MLGLGEQLQREGTSRGRARKLCAVILAAAASKGQELLGHLEFKCLEGGRENQKRGLRDTWSSRKLDVQKEQAGRLKMAGTCPPNS